MVAAKNSSAQMVHRRYPTAASGLVTASAPWTRVEAWSITHLSGSDRGVASVNRELAVAEPLRRRLASARDREHFIEETGGGTLERVGIVDDAADIEIDVVGHLPRRAAVARDLDHRGNRISRRSAQAGREDHDLCAASNHPCDRLDVEA